MVKSTLLRYNFRILMHHNWWLLVIPLAASQLSVFFTLVTQRFAPMLPVSTVEATSPLLAAFLCAHLLAAEYRSGIGGVLASKPVDIAKIVLLRFFIVMMLVWGLGFLSLAAFYYGMDHFPLFKPAISCVVSSLFLGMLALTFATLFRHPLAGFGVAAVYWLFDLAPGPPVNHLMSLKSLTASFPAPGVPPGQPLSDVWLPSKCALLIAAVVLYVLHTRLLFTLGSPLTLRRRRRSAAWAAGLLLFYLVSGGVLKVIAGYENRGKLYPDDVAWFRQQFSSYGPIPVSALFGPNFRSYLGDIPSTWRIQQDSEADLIGDTAQHRAALSHLLTRAPGSIWAPSAAILMARMNLRASVPLEKQIAGFQFVVDRYPHSPYEAFALWQIGRTYAAAFETDPAYEGKSRSAYEALLARYPISEYNADAYGFLAQSDRRHNDDAAAAVHAGKWIESAPIYEKFKALMLLAEILRDQGKAGAARATALAAKRAVEDFRRAKNDGKLRLPEGRLVRVERDAAEVDQESGRF